MSFIGWFYTIFTALAYLGLAFAFGMVVGRKLNDHLRLQIERDIERIRRTRRTEAC